MTDTLSAYNPSWRERLQGAVQDAMTGMGASRGYAQDFAGKAGDLISMVPGAGNALSANDAYRSYQSGDYLGAALNGAMALPLPLATPEEDAARGIIAYHGSPYSFDKFDASKIGTGQGAQTYGHGLYFAQNEGVAKDYRNQLSPMEVEWPTKKAQALFQTLPQWQQDNINGLILNGHENIRDILNMRAATARHEMTMDPSDLGRSSKPIGGEQAAQIYETLAAMRQMPRPKQSGSMYQVRINADPNQFLDWDKPLSEQPNIQQKLEEQGYYTDLNPNYSGSDVHSMTGSLILGRAGIPGIRYLDQGSRGAGGGTYNYVVFDPNTIDILKRYGMAGGLAGTGVGAAIMNPPAQAQPQL